MSEENTLQASIKKTLNIKEENKKQISLMLEAELLKSLDVITEKFKDMTKGKISSRNQLVELALAEYVKEASVVLLEYGDNIEELVNNIDTEEEEDLSEEEEIVEDMVAIFPARNEGFEKVFLGQQQWYSIRIAKYRINKISYVACYRTAPYSEITHYAKVKDIVQFEGSNKYKIIFDGEAIPLPQPIRRGIHDVTGIRSTRYTTLNKLLEAKEIWNL